MIPSTDYNAVSKWLPRYTLKWKLSSTLFFITTRARTYHLFPKRVAALFVYVIENYTEKFFLFTLLLKFLKFHFRLQRKVYVQVQNQLGLRKTQERWKLEDLLTHFWMYYELWYGKGIAPAIGLTILHDALNKQEERFPLCLRIKTIFIVSCSKIFIANLTILFRSFLWSIGNEKHITLTSVDTCSPWKNSK